MTIAGKYFVRQREAIPVHRQPVYLKLGYGDVSLPITEKAAAEVLSLPMYPELRREQIEYVAQAVREATQ